MFLNWLLGVYLLCFLCAFRIAYAIVESNRIHATPSRVGFSDITIEYFAGGMELSEKVLRMLFTSIQALEQAELHPSKGSPEAAWYEGIRKGEEEAKQCLKRFFAKKHKIVFTKNIPFFLFFAGLNTLVFSVLFETVLFLFSGLFFIGGGIAILWFRKHKKRYAQFLFSVSCFILSFIVSLNKVDDIILIIFLFVMMIVLFGSLSLPTVTKKGTALFLYLESHKQLQQSGSDTERM